MTVNGFEFFGKFTESTPTEGRDAAIAKAKKDAVELGKSVS